MGGNGIAQRLCATSNVRGCQERFLPCPSPVCKSFFATGQGVVGPPSAETLSQRMPPAHSLASNHANSLGEVGEEEEKEEKEKEKETKKPSRAGNRPSSASSLATLRKSSRPHTTTYPTAQTAREKLLAQVKFAPSSHKTWLCTRPIIYLGTYLPCTTSMKLHKKPWSLVPTRKAFPLPRYLVSFI